MVVVVVLVGGPSQLWRLCQESVICSNLNVHGLTLILTLTLTLTLAPTLILTLRLAAATMVRPLPQLAPASTDTRFSRPEIARKRSQCCFAFASSKRQTWGLSMQDGHGMRLPLPSAQPQVADSCANNIRRPKVITEQNSIPSCEKWRGQVVKEISRKVTKIQDRM